MASGFRFLSISVLEYMTNCPYNYHIKYSKEKGKYDKRIAQNSEICQNQLL